VSKLELSYSGYVCAPYLHNHESIELKDSWVKSKNIEKLFFVTGTFSSESKPYFSDSTNHYLLAKFKDSSSISKELSEHNQDKTSFMFNIKDELFQREVKGDINFISVYYLEYGDDGEDLQEIANLLLKRDKMYSENIIVIEVASEKSHQSVKKYCDQTKRDANRKGMAMANLLSLSILEQLK
jgi:hypothetical protein